MRLPILLVLAASASAPGAAAPAFHVEPGNPVLVGDPVQIRLDGLRPGATVQIESGRRIHSSLLGNRDLWFGASASFTANEKGELDLATAAPTAGSSYQGASVHGLFWSMVATEQPVPEGAAFGVVQLVARSGDAELASTQIAFIQSLPEVIVEDVPGFPGAVFAHLPGKQRRPALIVLGGAEGGSKAAREEAPRLASRGYAVLGLPYYSPASFTSSERELPALPSDFADIELNRLNDARAWLRKRRDVAGDKIGLYGASKGAEFALLAASHFDWVKAAVLYAPSDVVWEGFGFGLEEGKRSSFALAGKPLPFVPYVGLGAEYMNAMAGQPLVLRRPHDRGRAAHPDRAVAARIHAEDYKGPLLLIAGQDDQLWAAGMMAHNIAERRVEAGLDNTVPLIYPDAGHYVTGSGWAPTTHYNAGPERSGGTPAGNAAAQIDAWPKLLAFLQASLR